MINILSILRTKKFHLFFRCLSKDVSKTSVHHQVMVSKSENIFHNLALEDWLYENKDLSGVSVLLLWKSSPCVVIGRHQNPWVECNVPYCQSSGIKVARRKSGGVFVIFFDNKLCNVNFFSLSYLFAKNNFQH